MNAGLIARRYATVLYDFALGRNVLDDVYNDARNISQAMAAREATTQLLASPLRKPSEKKTFLKNAFEKFVTPTTMEFMLFVVDKERVSILSEILRVFQIVYKQRQGIKSASITTAKELSADKQNDITKLIEDKLSSKVEAQYRTDESIIGGAIITIDGKQLDCSVLHQLKEIEKRLAV